MLENLLSFLLSWTNAGQCDARLSFLRLPASSAKNVAATNVPVTHVYTVSETIVALQIRVGDVVRGRQVAYAAQPDDVVNDEGWVYRDGNVLGQLLPQQPDVIWLVDQYVGPKLDTKCADTLNHYQITTANGTRIKPTNLHRKSKIDSVAQTDSWTFNWPMVHTIYLELPEALRMGEIYQFSFAKDFLQDTEFVYNPEQTRSESVQISHVGFDPEDVAKVAFLSTWMGDGGGLNYSEGTPFWLIDTATGEKVYQGVTALSQSKDYKNMRGRNYNQTDVYIMDFSDFSTPGNYTVYVEGVGTSYEFEIGENTWRDAFYVSARGMYHQRSGIALEQPYTDYERPRPFHPDDGVVVYRSTVPLMDTNMGFKFDSEVDAFEALVATRTDEEVPNAWGGWMDAGDWDRRIHHLQITRSFLELIELYPDYFATVDLNIPESNNSLPDLLDEALWGLDVFRRLQTKEGGIPGGIESAGHPIRPEGSWQESQTVMTYGPGIWSSYYYANVAARAAYVLADYDSALAQTYQDSAMRAMNWANAELAKTLEESDASLASAIYDERHLAAAELYRLTGDNQWHQLFLDTTVFKDPDAPLMIWVQHDHTQAAFVYSRTEHPTVDKTIQQNATNAILRTAEVEIENIERTGFKWNPEPSGLVGWGSMTTPKNQTLFHAHTLTQDDKYLRAGLLATQFAAGANPSNMSYTVGVGHNNPQMPLILDSRALGQEPPPGITVYGPVDIQDPNGHAPGWEWAINTFTEEMTPSPWQWPTSEAYFDFYYYVPATEFTVHQSIGPTAYAWGYLAANGQD